MLFYPWSSCAKSFFEIKPERLKPPGRDNAFVSEKFTG